MFIKSNFKKAWWLGSSNLQTVFDHIFYKNTPVDYQRERLELPDGDFLDIDWADPDPSRPLVLVFHGLESSSRAPYIRLFVETAYKHDYGVAALNCRNCSEETNRLAISYHMGKSEDLESFVVHVHRRYPGRKLYGLGYSAGGNMLLKWLSEQRDNTRMTAAAAISVPMELSMTVDHLTDKAKFYNRRYVRMLKDAVAPKVKSGLIKVAEAELEEVATFREFDDLITAPLNDFKDSAEYYAYASSRYRLKDITTPTLILHALDDPIVPVEALPAEDEISESITFELSDFGGHVGFVHGSNPFRPRRYVETRVLDFFTG